jgi:DNA transposition AAA+ family ATPase
MMTPKQMCVELIEFGGMTQLAIALAIGYTPAGISRVMTGSNRSMRYETGRRLEEFYVKNKDRIQAEKHRKLAEIQASLKAAQ